MRLVALLDPTAPVAIQLSWVLTLARAAEEDVLLLVAGDGSSADDEDTTSRRQVVQARTCVEEAPGFRFVEDPDAEDGEEFETDQAERAVHAEVLRGLEGLAERVQAHETDLFLILQEQLEAHDEHLAKIGRDVLPAITCRVGVLRFGSEEPPATLRVAVPGADGPHTRAALQLARSLAELSQQRASALMVQQPLGADSDRVGHRALQRTLRRALGEAEADRFEHVIELHDDLAKGLGKSLDRGRHDLVVMGSWLGQLSARFLGTPAGRLLRRSDPPAVLVLREAMPFTNRLRRVVEKFLQSRVPQLARDDRTRLFERVQSNSAWNFDFVALIVLSTVIASIGLLQDSAAVVIGAMLVAPLMSPILGMGFALVQGNAVLVWSAVRSVFFGVGLAYVASLFVGLVAAGEDPTDQMLGRGAPDLRDLFVAFFSGLAAAYASSRENLFSALPGVAIAAALVPPIATSGLATTMGQFELARMSMLLFVTNFVTIVIASALSLAAVGLRSTKGTATWMRALRLGLAVGLATVIAFLLQSSRSFADEEAEFRRVVREWAEPLHQQLDGCQVLRGEGYLTLDLRCGGESPVTAAQRDDLLNQLSRRIPGQPIRLRISHEHVAPPGSPLGEGR